VVVIVGLVLVEPLAAVDVNVPGVMAILVAPVAAQLNVLLVPEFMLVGFAVNEAIVGVDPFSEDVLDGFVVPQPGSPPQAIRIRTSKQISSPDESRSREARRFPQTELVESMRDIKQTQVYCARGRSSSSPWS
jgi:hypothetical protein